MTPTGHIVFLRALIANLDLLKSLLGEKWTEFSGDLIALLDDLAREDKAMIIVEKTDRLCRTFENTPADQVVRILLEQSLRTEAPGTAEWASVRQDLAKAADDLAGEDAFGTMRSGRRGGASSTLADASDEGQAAFHFVLRGEGARGNAMRLDAIAHLLFDYAVPPDDALSREKSALLDDARARNADILLVATGRGAVEIVGKRAGLAKFADGKLQKQVSFDLRATATGKSSVHVEFLVQGESVHQTEIEIDVVSAESFVQLLKGRTHAASELPPTLAELATSASAPPPQRIALGLSYAGGSLRLSLTDFRRGDMEFSQEYQSESMDRTRVETLLKRIHADLRDVYIDQDFWAAFDGDFPADAAKQDAEDALAQAVARVAAAGSRLNEELRSDPQIAQALDYIETQAGEGAVLSVATDDTFLPWELLYPEHRSAHMLEEDAANPVMPRKFWGVRFAIETEKRGIGSLTALRDTHVRQPPKVTLNLNPSIKVKGQPDDRQPLAVQQAWGEALARQGRLDGIQATCKDMRPVVQNAQKDASLIYVYCHGSSPDAFGGADETLLLADNCSLEPRDLRGGPAYRGAPIVFLNSCKAGVSSPLTFSSFLKEFRLRGALGMIATSFSVPIAFGARFGQEVIDCYLNRKGSLAVELLQLRRKHLLERGDPVPLFYTLQCHLDVPAPVAQTP